MLSLIVAMSENHVIGRDGDLPWRLSADLQRFKQITMGHHIIMGRKTYESIGRPLPGRISIVVSRTAHFDHPAIRMANSLEQALGLTEGDSEPFITGGARLFRESLPQVDRIYLTQVRALVEGDTEFPSLEWDAWRLRDEEHFQADAKNQYDYSFLTYDRIK